MADKLSFRDQRDLTYRLRTHLQAFGSIHDYPVAFETPAGPVDREDELYFVGVGASYKFLRWLRLGLLIGPWERNSNISGESANGIRWQILLSFN